MRVVVALSLIATPAIAEKPVVVKEAELQWHRQAKLAFDRPGVIAKLTVEEGDVVQPKGEMARLDDRRARAAHALAKLKAESDIDLRYARKNTAVARKELEQAQAANAQLTGAVPRLELERLKLAAERAELQAEQAADQIKQAAQELRAAKADLDTHQLLAPFGGVVTRREKLVGEAVQQGETVVTITQTNEIRAEGTIAAADRMRIKSGDPVVMTVPGYKQPIRGKLVFIGLKARPIDQGIQVWALFKNPGGLVAGLPVVMTIEPATPNK